MDFLAILRIFSSFNLSEFAAEGEDNLGCTAESLRRWSRVRPRFPSLPSPLPAPSERCERSGAGRGLCGWRVDSLPPPRPPRCPDRSLLAILTPKESQPFLHRVQRPRAPAHRAKMKTHPPPPRSAGSGGLSVSAHATATACFDQDAWVSESRWIGAAAASERQGQGTLVQTNRWLWGGVGRAAFGQRLAAAERRRVSPSQPPVRQSLGRALLVSEGRGAARGFEVRRIL